ncbi:MAG: DUF2235 domain-containing protein [Leptolyngbya sp. RL_3_1]|nr:DUF2235 domain-containing protein [Leptolyngbya sp. RL_3_1]
MAKRLIVCCDGTWNSLNMACPTNVVKLSQACQPTAIDGTPQILYYDEGLGTSGYVVDKLLGGAFGWGIDENIQDAYRFLCLNYTDGDKVYLFGFSRGAYTVRSLAGMIYCSGLLPHQHITQIPTAYEIYRAKGIKPDSEAAKQFRKTYDSPQIDITLLGCWDTVGALGIPQLLPALPINDLVNAKYRFHDNKLNYKIQYALHAVAIDEHRRPFDVNLMCNSTDPTSAARSLAQTPQIQQVWFPGTHGCVGGGTAELTGLSDITLQWMIESVAALGLGLGFDHDWLAQHLDPDPTIPFDANDLGIYRLAGRLERPIDLQTAKLHPSVEARYQAPLSHPYRPENLLAATGWPA